MRELTMTELELVAGGSTSDVTELDEIVVTGPGDGGGGGDWGDWGDWGDYGDYGDYGDGGGSGGGSTDTAPPPDEASVDVTDTINRPLTADEQKAVNDLKATINDVTKAINALSDASKITLPDGSTVTGLELKSLWAKTDFVINEVGTAYANGTTNGESNWNNGDPVFSFNIDLLEDYSNLTGGMEYLALHELAHATQTGRAHNASSAPDNEQVANDIARAIANAGGLDILTNPGGGGYSTTAPIVFTQPSGGSSGGSSSGGGGQEHAVLV